MSRIGKKPVPLTPGVKAALQDGRLTVTGPHASLTQLMPPRIKIDIGAQEITLTPEDDSRLSRSYWGLARTLAANMVIGVSDGFSRVLELVGTGYKVESKGGSLVFSIGYSNPVDFPLPEGISAQVEKATRIEL
ncbi:MAG: 50S ribosomal protein L6 [Desulfobaccales bacterium]